LSELLARVRSRANLMSCSESQKSFTQIHQTPLFHNAVKYFSDAFTIAFCVAVTCVAALWLGLHSFLFAWAFNIMLMAISRAIMEALKPRLQSSFYHSKPWERKGSIYKWVGVNLFRKGLVLVGWEKQTKASFPP
jgi:hypothetical protein